MRIVVFPGEEPSEEWIQDAIGKISSGVEILPPVHSFGDLENVEMKTGVVRFVESEAAAYICTGDNWCKLMAAHPGSTH